MDRREKSPGWGDGDKAVIAPDIFRASVTYNGTHKHLPGDFIKRDKDGDHVLIKWEKFDNLQMAAYFLWVYWKSCNAKQHDLDDFQISELDKRMRAIAKMLGKPVTAEDAGETNTGENT